MLRIVVVSGRRAGHDIIQQILIIHVSLVKNTSFQADCNPSSTPLLHLWVSNNNRVIPHNSSVETVNSHKVVA